MAIISSLKKNTLIPGVFAGMQAGPKPATIYIKLPYHEKFDYLRKIKGFTIKSPSESANPEGYIEFKIPVTPPTIQIDTGNTKDTEQVARVGEVVLPKYKKAIQVRWESFFPYDVSSPYLSTRVRSTFSDIGKMATTAAKTLFSNLLDLDDATPTDYINIFIHLSKTEKPFELSMTFYDGGHFGTMKCTLESFQTEPETNGDYKYNISVIQWIDVKPKQLNVAGQQLPSSGGEVSDKSMNKAMKGLSDFFNFCKNAYGAVSKSLLWAVASLNKVRNFAITTELMTWRIKGDYKKYTTRLSILSNILGKSRITSNDTKYISKALRELSFAKASQQMAELLKNNIRQ